MEVGEFITENAEQSMQAQIGIGARCHLQNTRWKNQPHNAT